MRRNTELYDHDFYAWTQETAALIAAGKWQEIDQALLADEVAGLGRDDQRRDRQARAADPQGITRVVGDARRAAWQLGGHH